MASIVFATVGQAAGGPLGAAVGAAVGGSIDGALFGGNGPGAGDRLLHRSNYGETIPRLYGNSRQSGILIWATPLMKTGGGKGGGRKAYTASFAIALSSRPISGIGRIWADGREMRNEAGAFATETRFRVHTGIKGDPGDPVITGYEGISNSPAYHGLAYVVFEALDLSPYGSRIPDLSFEVFADPVGTTPGEWLRDLAALAAVEADPAGATVAIEGYSAGLAQYGGDVQMLARVADISEAYAGGRLVFQADRAIQIVPEGEFCASDQARDGWASRRTAALSDRPAGFEIGYSDPDRDYLPGSQQSDRDRPGRRLRLGGSLSATAAQARTLAERLLRRTEAAAETLEIALGWRWLGLTVGDRLQISGQQQMWRVVRRDIEGMIVRLVCEACPDDGSDPVLAGSPGRVLSAPVVPVPPTTLDIFELPTAIGGVGGEGFWVAASGLSGWRGAEVDWSVSGGDWQGVGSLSESAVTGRLLAPLAARSGQLWDNQSILEVELDREKDWLESRTEGAVLAGANMLWVAGELLQFRTAAALGSRRFRLSGLLRNRLGSVSPAVTPDGARIVRLDAGRALFQRLGTDAIGQILFLRGRGAGDPGGGVLEQMLFAGAGIAPLGPCHVRIQRQPDGGLDVSWVARDRAQFDWTASEPAAVRGYVCRFVCTTDGIQESVSKNASGLGFHYSAEAQILDFGHILQDFALEVESSGDGPVLLRTSKKYDF